MAAGRGCSAPVTRGEGVSGDSRAPIGGRHLWTRHAQSGRNETSPRIPNHQVQNQLGDPVPLTLNSDNDFSKRLTRPAATNLIKVRLPGPRPHPPGAWPPGRWRPRPGPPLAPRPSPAPCPWPVHPGFSPESRSLLSQSSRGSTACGPGIQGGSAAQDPQPSLLPLPRALGEGLPLRALPGRKIRCLWGVVKGSEAPGSAPRAVVSLVSLCQERDGAAEPHRGIGRPGQGRTAGPPPGRGRVGLRSRGASAAGHTVSLVAPTRPLWAASFRGSPLITPRLVPEQPPRGLGPRQCLAMAMWAGIRGTPTQEPHCPREKGPQGTRGARVGAFPPGSALLGASDATCGHAEALGSLVTLWPRLSTALARAGGSLESHRGRELPGVAVASQGGPWLLLGPVPPGDVARGHGKGARLGGSLGTACPTALCTQASVEVVPCGGQVLRLLGPLCPDKRGTLPGFPSAETDTGCLAPTAPPGTWSTVPACRSCM